MKIQAFLGGQESVFFLGPLWRQGFLSVLDFSRKMKGLW